MDCFFKKFEPVFDRPFFHLVPIHFMEFKDYNSVDSHGKYITIM